MRTTGIFTLAFFLTLSSFAGSIEKTYYFAHPKIHENGTYQTIHFEHTRLMAKPGEPVMPYHPVSLLLPPGDIAIGIEVIAEDEVVIPGQFEIYPQQHSLPLSKSEDIRFIKNESIYLLNGKYPSSPAAEVSTHYMNGYAFALTAFTPLTYHPSTKTISYFSRVTIRISTKQDDKSIRAMTFLSSAENTLKRVLEFAQNPEMINLYPKKTSSSTAYQYLVISPQQFVSQYDSLLDYYAETGISSQVKTTEWISSNYPGHDLQQKIRNCIKQEVTLNDIEFVLLGGDVEHIPYRGFYCYAVSDPNQEDINIPADLYYSALDGEWNDTNLIGGHIEWWGEPGEDDLLPDVAVSRFPISTAEELQHMVHKSLYYQKYPVLGEFTKPYMAGEFLYSPPPTYGSDYMELLIDDHNDNGYFTHGIPSAGNIITRIYDTPSYSWNKNELIAGINSGKSFIHHLGHSNWDYMMRLSVSDITNQAFSSVNGVNHNFTLIYTQGCIAGAFDYPDCIAEKAVTINNFCVAGVFNSRFGWFNQGTTDGPSQHLQREFVSALYNDTLENQVKELGAAHMISKIKTAPWVGIPGEFEPGAQRWVHYDCNALGDPALKIWTTAPALSVLPANQDVPSSSGSTTFTVTSNASWNALSEADWCTVTSTGNGNGSIIASFEANPEEQFRTARITISAIGATPVMVTVTQAPLVSVEELMAGHVRFFPNPVKEELNISFHLLNPGDVYIRLNNITGQLVRETFLPLQSAGNHLVSMNVKDLVPGFYSCSFELEKGRETKKILIIK